MIEESIEGQAARESAIERQAQQPVSRHNSRAEVEADAAAAIEDIPVWDREGPQSQRPELDDARSVSRRASQASSQEEAEHIGLNRDQIIGQEPDRKKSALERWPGKLLAGALMLVTGGIPFLLGSYVAYKVNQSRGTVKRAKSVGEGFRNFFSYAFSFGQDKDLWKTPGVKRATFISEFETPREMVKVVLDQLHSGNKVSSYLLPIYTDTLDVAYKENCTYSFINPQEEGSGRSFLTKPQRKMLETLVEQTDKNASDGYFASIYVNKYVKNMVEHIKRSKHNKILIPLSLVGGHAVLLVVEKDTVGSIDIGYYDPKGGDALQEGKSQWIADNQSDKRFKISIRDLVEGISRGFSAGSSIESSKVKHQKSQKVLDSEVYVAMAMRDFWVNDGVKLASGFSREIQKERKHLYAEISQVIKGSFHNQDMQNMRELHDLLEEDKKLLRKMEVQNACNALEKQRLNDQHLDLQDARGVHFGHVDHIADPVTSVTYGSSNASSLHHEMAAAPENYDVGLQEAWPRRYSFDGDGAKVFFEPNDGSPSSDQGIDGSPQDQHIDDDLHAEPMHLKGRRGSTDSARSGISLRRGSE